MVEVPPGVAFPERSQTASMPWVGPLTGHVLLSFALISLDQRESRGAATSGAEVASISTQSHTTLMARAHFHREYFQRFVTVLATQPVCQPPSPASVLPTEMMGILCPGFYHSRQVQPPALAWKGP